MLRRVKLGKFVRFALLAVVLATAGLTLYLDFRVRSEFEGRRFALPARIYARPLELHAGLRVAQADVEDELRQLGYREAPPEGESGWFAKKENALEIALRPFVFWDGAQPAKRVSVGFEGGKVTLLRDAAGAELALARLEPLPIGGIYPAGNEDRVLVRLNDVPKHLVQALIAVEDRNFFSHAGFDPRAVARALWSLTSDKVQGGSTITQQLVKNFFLTPERTLRRKFTELLMAVLLEVHYDKNEILETYLNEIYFGQDRDRAIHGVGLAAQFYFGKDIQHLTPAESALLVGLIRGPAHYDPYRHPNRALERRNLVLREARDRGGITLEEYTAPRASALVARRGWGPRATPPSCSSCTGSCGATTTKPICARRACASSPRSIRACRTLRRPRSPSASPSSTRSAVSASPGSKARWWSAIRKAAKSRRWSADATRAIAATTARSMPRARSDRS
jgi:penicillin-binding protein 1B